jgi:hypothetical protein
LQGFNETINELTDFYPELVKYLSTLDYSGKIKTSTNSTGSAGSVVSVGSAGSADTGTVSTTTGGLGTAGLVSRYKVLPKPTKNSRGYSRRSSHTYNSTVLSSQNINIPKLNKLATRLSNINSIYNSSSPVFKELFFILNNNELNNETQLKIEQFLLDQSKEFNEAKLEAGVNNTGQSNISHALALEFIESKKLLRKLIENYQTNLKLDVEALSDTGQPATSSVYPPLLRSTTRAALQPPVRKRSASSGTAQGRSQSTGKKDSAAVRGRVSDAVESSLESKIMSSMDVNFLIAISFGRILNIINNHQQVNKLNSLAEVSIDLGKEITKKYIFNSYLAFQKTRQSPATVAVQSPAQSNGEQSTENEKITLLMWKKNNNTLVEATESSHLRFDLGNILIN